MKLGDYKASKLIKPVFPKKNLVRLIFAKKLLKMMVFRLFSQNYSKELLQIAYVNRKLCILSNAKDRRFKKNSPSTSFRILTALKHVKTRFLANFLSLKHLYDLIFHILKILKRAYELKSVSVANKFSSCLILHINRVKTCKNWFLSQFLEFEASV